MTRRSKQNRLYLYLLCPDGEPGAFQWIGSAHGFLPSLWQVLLSHGAQNSALHQVLGGEATSCTSVDAAAALTRYRRLVAFLRRHPQFDQVAGLGRYLDAVELYLTQMIGDWRISGRAPPVLRVNLAQLPAGESASVPAQDHLSQLQEFGARLDEILGTERFDAVEQLLRFPTRNLRFTDWRAWSGMFGLAQFEPVYFSAAFRRPFAGDYLDHDYDELGSEPPLANGRYRFKVADRWGVCAEGDHDSIILEPQWDRVLRTSVGEQSLVWVKRSGRFGLASIAGDDAGRLLHDPDLDEVHAFRAGLAIVRRDEKMGLLKADGNWHLSPCVDEVHAYANGYAVIRNKAGFGFIDVNAAIAIDPHFDEADDFNVSGVARVRSGDRCGLIRGDGSFALPLQFSSIEWSETFAGWLCERDGLHSLVHADGSKWVDADWDAIEVFVPGHLLRVRRGEYYGVLRWQGEALLPCEFEELLTRDTYGVGPISAQGKKSQVRTLRLRDFPAHRFADERPVQVVARRNGQVGLISETGRVLVPFDFSYVDALEPHFEDGRQLIKPELVRVVSVPRKSAPRVGVWDMAQQRCIVPCEYDFVWMTLFGVADSYGFIVGNRNPKRGCAAKGRYRVGILHADGRTLVPQEYAWIGECTPLNRDDAMGDLRSTLYHCWSQGEPVRASINENGPMAGLPPPDVEQVQMPGICSR